MAAPLFLVTRMPAAGSFLVERSAATPLRADLMQESRQERGGSVQIASLLVLRAVDAFERQAVLQELAARYRSVEDLPCDLPGATLHRLVIGQNVVAARGLASISQVHPDGPSWTRIAHGVLETLVPLRADVDGRAAAAQLQKEYRAVGIDAQTRVDNVPSDDLQVWRLLVERCGPAHVD